MARLPIPGSDDNTWGNILNTFLQVSFNSDGTLQGAAITQAGGITTTQVGTANGVAGLNGSGIIPATQLGSGTASTTTYLRGDGSWQTPSGSGGSSTLAGDTDVTITSPSNNQVLTYSTSSSKWTNQTPTTAPVTTVFGRSGTVVAASNDYAASQVTNAADKSSSSAQAFTGNVSAPAIIATGLTGSTAASRYVGATTSNAPTSGTFAVGDFVIDQTGKIWICTTAPGTWTQATTSIDSNASHILALGSQAAGSNGKAADSGHVHPTTGVVLQAGSTMSGYLAPAVSALTGATTVAVNVSSGNIFTLTLTSSSWTLGAPTNAVDGQLIRFRLTQGTGGSFTLAYNAIYDFGSGSAPTLSTAAGKVDVLAFEYNAALTKWCYFGSGTGF